MIQNLQQSCLKLETGGWLNCTWTADNKQACIMADWGGFTSREDRMAKAAIIPTRMRELRQISKNEKSKCSQVSRFVVFVTPQDEMMAFWREGWQPGSRRPHPHQKNRERESGGAHMKKKMSVKTLGNKNPVMRCMW